LADDPSDKAVLGPAEPIGKLLVVKAGFDDEPEPLPPAPIPLLEPEAISLPPGLLLNPAHFNTTASCAVMPTTTQIDASEIPFHLSQAILGLTAAGLTEEAERVSSLLKEFQTKHQARLLLAAKQAQLNELRAEIDRLKLRIEKGITAEQVSVSIKIIEIDEGDGRKAFTGNPHYPKNGETAKHSSLTKTLDKGEFQELMTRIQDVKGARVLSSPTLIVLSGQQGQVQSGGKYPIPEIALAGGPKEISYGTFLTATPTIMDKDQVRLQVDIEASEMDEANGATLNGKFVPGLTRRRFQSTLDLKDGQTTIFGGLVSTRNEQTTEMFVVVTAEIVQPFDESNAPTSPRPIPSPPLK
jgi:Flp pilus assembly secretin CpaC